MSFRPFLLRRTILPDGKFRMAWEIIQVIRIIFMGIFYFPLPVLASYMSNTWFIWTIADIIGTIDMWASDIKQN